MGNLCHLYQRQLYKQAFVAALSVAQVALIEYLQRLIQELWLTPFCLLGVSLASLVACLDELGGLWVGSHKHVSHVGSEPVYHLSSVKAFCQEFVNYHHDVAHLVFEGEVDDVEIVFGIEHVEVFQYLLVGYVALTETCRLVEDGEGIAHTSVSLLGYHVECLVLIGVAFFLGNPLEVVDDVLYRHALEVVYLASGYDGRQNLVLLCCGEDENYVLRRFLQCFKEGIECLCREHVHLVYDKHFVLARLRWYACLLHELLDVLHTII